MARKTDTHGRHEQEWLTLPEGEVLVFGLRWFPIVGSRVAALARKKAYEAHATHYVQGGANSSVVGCARLRASRKTYYAAAQLFARIYPHGTVAGLLLLSEARTWLVATQDGAVMARTDRIYPNVTMATAALDELEMRHPGVARSVRRLELNDLSAALDASAALWRLGLALGRFSISIRGSAKVMALALLSYPLWYMWREEASPVHQADIQIDPVHAWREAVAATAKAIMRHEPKMLSHVLDSLKALPTALRGWSLHSAHCRAETQTWQCNARYVRAAPTATNERLAAALPAFVQIAFSHLEEADITWKVRNVMQPLDPELLASTSHTDKTFASLLQRLRPIFAHMTLGTPMPLIVLPPRDTQGQVLPRPQNLPHMRQRSIRLAGPLRSFSLLTAPPAAIAWTEVSLSVEGARLPTVAASPLMAQLQGTVYERE